MKSFLLVPFALLGTAWLGMPYAVLANENIEQSISRELSFISDFTAQKTTTQGSKISPVQTTRITPTISSVLGLHAHPEEEDRPAYTFTIRSFVTAMGGTSRVQNDLTELNSFANKACKNQEGALRLQDSYGISGADKEVQNWLRRLNGLVGTFSCEAVSSPTPNENVKFRFHVTPERDASLSPSFIPPGFNWDITVTALDSKTLEDIKQAEKDAKAKDERRKKEVEEFRRRITVGDDVSYIDHGKNLGLVTEVKLPLVKVQSQNSNIGERWYKIEEIYPAH